MPVHGKGGKIRFIPAHPRAVRLIEVYLDAGGHRSELASPLFRPVAANMKDTSQRLNPGSVCLAAAEAKPIGYLVQIGRTLSIKRFTEYGANQPVFKSLLDSAGSFRESDLSEVLAKQLAKPVSVLDLTPFQREGLERIGLDTVGKALDASEEEFQRIYYVGPKRSRRIKNVVVASVLEYLSG